MNKTIARALMLVALGFAVGLGGCGGATTKKGMTDLAAGAPPPPPGGGATGGPKRQVSREARSDFADAAKAHRAAAEGGWTADECRSMAGTWDSVADDHPKLIEARYNAGVSYQNCRMFKDAEREFQSALKANPGHGPSLSNLGTIYFLGGNRERAMQYWNKAVQADTTLSVTGARANLAWMLIEKIRGGAASPALEKEARDNLSRALAVEFENKEAYVMYALLYLEGAEKNKSRLALANLLLDKAEEIDPSYAPIHNARGLFLLKQENVAQALVSFRRAVQLDPKFVEAMMNVGAIVLDFRKYDEAAAAFDAVLKVQPKNYDAMVGLGIAQRGLRQYDQAEATYQQAQKLQPSRAEAYFNLGVLYQDFRANEESIRDDFRAIQAAYRKAAGYFRDAKSKSNATKSIQRDADDNIDVCEKNIKTLDENIKFQSQGGQNS
jgi:tetratricopeptide (TPR) repeat protein